MSRFQSTLAAPFVAVAILLMLVACGTGTSSTPQPLPPVETPSTVAAAPTNTPESAPVDPTATVESQPVATETVAMEPSATTEAAPEATTTSAAATPAPDATTPPTMDDDYFDNRNNPESLMESFVNALNRHEYLRAYSYWDADRAENLPSFEEFEAGYAETDAVKLQIGEIMGDAGAGNFYYTVPVTMESRLTSGDNQVFVGCYLLHLSNPGVQGTPPFRPLGIESAFVQEVAADTDTGAAMSTICEEAGYPAGTPLPPAPTPSNPTDINAQVYIDDRSTPEWVLRSLFNAVNGSQYVRAYSYWESDAEGLPTFEEFEAGYVGTQVSELTIGDVTSDAGAGNLYYSVPVTLVAQTEEGTTTYVGCYVLHLSQPAVQATPPFQPLAIRSATVEQVGDGEDTAALMATACAQ